MEPKAVAADAAIFESEKAEHGAGNLPPGWAVADPGSDMIAGEGPLRHHIVISSHDLINGDLEWDDIAPESFNMGYEAFTTERSTEGLVGPVLQSAPGDHWRRPPPNRFPSVAGVSASDESIP